jgi:hypothetical protein
VFKCHLPAVRSLLSPSLPSVFPSIPPSFLPFSFFFKTQYCYTATQAVSNWNSSSLCLLSAGIIGKGITPSSVCLSFPFYFGGTGVSTQGFVLTKQALTKQILYCLNHASSPFCSIYFGDRVSWTICLGWLRTVILPISASQVARITGMSHLGLASVCLSNQWYLCY